MRSIVRGVAILSLGACVHPRVGANPSPSPLLRQYRLGDRQRYEMVASHEDPHGVLRYSAIAVATVARDSGNHFVETVDWSGLVVNGSPVALAPANSQGVQSVTLDTAVIPSIPRLQLASPSLIGPMLDLMTFYVDLQLAAKQSNLRRTGDHRYVSVNLPASWADGQQVIVGQDAIDFDITLANVDRDSGVATLLVRHVPPKEPAIVLPAPWMKAAIGDEANNWIQIIKAGDRYLAAIGRETFDVTMKVSLADGRILSATMVNPVDVFERQCADRALAQCDAGRKYRIVRNVSVHATGS